MGGLNLDRDESLPLVLAVGLVAEEGFPCWRSVPTIVTKPVELSIMLAFAGWAHIVVTGVAQTGGVSSVPPTGGTNGACSRPNCANTTRNTAAALARSAGQETTTA